MIGLALALALTARAARRETDPSCRPLPVAGKIRVEQCEERDGTRVRLDLPRGPASLELYALFPHRSGGMFVRLWGAAAGAQKFRAGEQAALRVLAERLREIPGGGPAFSLARFLGDFAGPDFVLRDYDFRGTPPAPAARYTVICDRIGHAQAGTFTARGRRFYRRVVVGGGACMGRCGPGCAADGDRRAGRYTQECLNHDLCAYATGENMGDCEDEFWEAADGFLNAPYCS